ncbi:tellurite resistance TerB family protein [Ruegeria sp. YS9]|uniref:tellurite resistance TerB family protein n=1 Tax=Ruegeria sp. YS9 TaxID=2966453 RepID=UPI00214B644B|nr:tellurite resistance TerB family protein [Ruegeria sp. YS9]UUV05201.1 tellurite resistance TerB family protein [Ruegeria sp. YS9]
MSFMKTLASVAIGFAAAKGMEKYQKMGGMAGLQDKMQGAGGGFGADQLGKMAEQFGLPGGASGLQDMMSKMGIGGSTAGAAGLGGLLNAMQGAAKTANQHTGDMMETVFGGTPAGAAMEEQAKLMLRAMIQAAKADGELDEQEKEIILGELGDDVSEEERAFVQEQLNAPIDVMGLAADSGAPLKTQIYATSLAAIRLDNAREASYLRQLSTALGLSDAERDQIHTYMGAPTLPG